MHPAFKFTKFVRRYLRLYGKNFIYRLLRLTVQFANEKWFPSGT